MTTKPDIPNGAPCWMDLMTPDVDKSARFYNELFGWEAQDQGPELGGYRVFFKEGEPVGGLMQNAPEFNSPDGFGIFLRTDDVELTAKKAAANGASTLVEPMDVTDNGSFAVFVDPGGAGISAWQPKKQHGFGRLYEADAPTWFELHTSAYDKTIEFYKEVFDWPVTTMSDDPSFRYPIYGAPESMKAGIMDSTPYGQELMPTRWSVYIGAHDVDATIAKAIDLGGTVVAAAEDTPYGRLATVTDSNGAVFKLRSA